jgi:hypothetical protein
MDDDAGYELIDEEDIETVVEQVVEQVADSVPRDVAVRATTASEWPPAPQPPAAYPDGSSSRLASGSSPELPQPVHPRHRQPKSLQRNASIYAAVRRPTTSNETT